MSKTKFGRLTATTVLLIAAVLVGIFSTKANANAETRKSSKKEYGISVQQNIGGDVQVAKKSVAGKKVLIRVNPEQGNIVTDCSVLTDKGLKDIPVYRKSAKVYWFRMPKEAVIVCVTFGENCKIRTAYNIGGTVIAPECVDGFKKVDFDVVPETGYIVSDVSVINDDGTEEPVYNSSSSRYYFVARKSCTIAVTFNKVILPKTRNIRVCKNIGGEVSLEGSYQDGDIVTVTVVPEEGWYAEDVSVLDENTCEELNITQIDGNRYEFVVAGDEAVCVTFNKTPLPKTRSIRVCKNIGGEVSLEGSYQDGDIVTVTVVPEEGWYAEDVSVLDENTCEELGITQIDENRYELIVAGDMAVCVTFDTID